LKALIKEICMMADKPWTLISDSDANDSKHVASPVKPTNQANLTKETSQTDRPKRIYRGQVVHN
jgi:hypothetical protein